MYGTNVSVENLFLVEAFVAHLTHKMRLLATLVALVSYKVVNVLVAPWA